jgi:hypothetical protein
LLRIKKEPSVSEAVVGDCLLFIPPNPALYVIGDIGLLAPSLDSIRTDDRLVEWLRELEEVVSLDNESGREQLLLLPDSKPIRDWASLAVSTIRACCILVFAGHKGQDMFSVRN